MRPSALFGKGSVERIGAKIAALNAEIAIIDWALSPVQQRNLERAWHCKVLDRTGLISKYSVRALGPKKAFFRSNWLP